ncbi:hypothetical protein INR49_029331 [Caranx melampygus]|nr:hypothetical protein INR49_029331 [Caranx melampygus]
MYVISSSIRRNISQEECSNLRTTMLLRSHSERRALPGFSALLTHTVPKQRDATSSPPLSFTPLQSAFTPTSLTSPPPWVTQALSNLEQGERELQSLRERQQAEVEEVNRELDSAVFEAQREERRLLEKIEQDHREAQQHLSQVKRENAAAVRVMQSLVDQQLRKMGQLKEQVQRWGSTAGGANKNQLQRGVAEVTQPWEISLSLKRVSFLPSPASKTLNLGEVDVREQGMTYPIGVCGVQGQKCALHSGDKTFSNITPLEIRKEPQSNRAGPRYSPDETNKTNSGNVRVVRKLRLSSSTENEDELKSPTVKSPVLRHRGVSESSQDEEVESVCSDTHGQDLFLAVPPVFSQGESEGDESDGRHNGKQRRSTLKGKKRQKALVLVSCEEPSCPPDDKSCDGAKSRRKGSLTRHSLVDLSSGHRPKKNNSSEPVTGSGSPPSPVDSEDSCYTYTVNTPVNGSLKQEPCRSMSTADLSDKLQPLINGDKSDHRGIRKVNKMRLASEPQNTEQNQANSRESDRTAGGSDERQPRSQTRIPQGSGLNRVSRSMSMSAIEGEKLHQVKESQPYNKDKERVVPTLRELEEEGGSTVLDSAYLVKQIGKQGSGRTDFNLPSGVHATVKGQLFVVDCGNARIQVTDLQKNVVQQVSPSGSERSSRICNYFDVAVNSKGLIALTCAAERALLVFSRHGRLLQTFGGTIIGSTNEELDAPRGVTVTRQDEFLVADIKRGTLTALKLDPKTGARLERTVVSGYHRPYLVAACLTTGLMAVSERGNETGRVPCIRVLEPGWNTIRILGVCSGLGPVLTCPWGLCIDSEGDVLVADWGKQHHRVLFYPSKGVGWPLVTDNLSSPRAWRCSLTAMWLCLTEDSTSELSMDLITKTLFLCLALGLANGAPRPSQSEAQGEHMWKGFHGPAQLSNASFKELDDLHHIGHVDAAFRMHSTDNPDTHDHIYFFLDDKVFRYYNHRHDVHVYDITTKTVKTKTWPHLPVCTSALRWLEGHYCFHGHNFTKFNPVSGEVTGNYPKDARNYFMRCTGFGHGHGHNVHKCSDVKLDAITTDDTGKTYLFAGHIYMRLDTNRDGFHPFPITRAWKEVTKGVDAVFSYSDRIYLIKDDQVYIYKSGVPYTLVQGYPKSVKEELGIEGHVDAAFVCEGEHTVHIIQGNKMLNVDLTATPRTVSPGLLLPVSDIDAAHCGTDGINIFKGSQFFTYESPMILAMGRIAPVPKPITNAMMGCVEMRSLRPPHPGVELRSAGLHLETLSVDLVIGASSDAAALAGATRLPDFRRRRRWRLMHLRPGDHSEVIVWDIRRSGVFL